MTFSSSTLTKLCINVFNFDDIDALLDGRLKQLTTFIVQVEFITNRISISYNMVSLCFVLFSCYSCFDVIRDYFIINHHSSEIS